MAPRRVRSAYVDEGSCGRPAYFELIGTYSRGGRVRWFDNFIIATRQDQAQRFQWSAPTDVSGVAG
jgi:hypothetical protein